MKGQLFLLFFLMFFGFASAATISGSIFDATTLDLIEGAIISINSVPKQTIVSVDATYSFEVPSGTYTITAGYFENSVLVLEEQQTITIENDGNFKLDLVLFPALGDEFDLDDLFDENGLIDENDFTTPPKNPQIDFTWIIVTVLVGLAFVVYIARKPKKPQNIQTNENISPVTNPQDALQNSVQKTELDKNAKTILETIKKSGNRLTQKDLREKTGLGEAQVSLILAELESNGLVKKIKQGRGNIIVLVKKEN